MSSYPLFFPGQAAQCPECRANISFQSAHANIVVCPSCNNVLERFEGQDILRKKKLKAGSQQWNSFLTTGTRGKYKGKSFLITGIIHCNMQQFYMHRCAIVFDDGTPGLLTETLGFYAIQIKAVVDFPGKLQQVNGLQVGTDTTELFRQSKMFATSRAKSEECFFSGEVIWTDTNDLFTITELAGSGNRYIEVIEYAAGNYEVFDIDYVLADELSLSGGPLQKIMPVTYACGKCSKPVIIKTPQYTQYAVCPACNAVSRHRHGVGLFHKDKKLQPFKPVIPVGAKGTIGGMEVEVLGVVKKYESGSISTTWTEYMLFNEKRGFAFLAEYNGHFTLLREEKLGLPFPQYQKELFTDNENYVLFNEYTFQVLSAAGEFFVTLDNSNIKAKEFISPPEMFAVENDNGHEITWYKGIHISAAEVFAGLNTGIEPPPAHGVGPLQPMKGYINNGLLARISAIAFVLFFAVQVFFSATAGSKELFAGSFVLPATDSLPPKPVVTPSFTLTPASSNIELTVSAAVGNSWFSADITLINEKTGKEINIEKGVEYYYGYSEGESWTEGSTLTDAMLSSVPGGTYHMNIFPAAGGDKKVDSFYISLKNDVPMWRNFFILLLLVALFPLVQWGRLQIFERQRWNNSPYNPYLKES